MADLYRLLADPPERGPATLPSMHSLDAPGPSSASELLPAVATQPLTIINSLIDYSDSTAQPLVNGLATPRPGGLPEAEPSLDRARLERYQQDLVAGQNALQSTDNVRTDGRWSHSG